MLIHNVEVTIEPNADLSGANLSRADLSGADLSRADLSGADLSEASLSKANLHGADLHGADLHGADLHGADLSWADLRGANLSWTKNYIDLGIDNRGYHFRAIAFAHRWQITAGCRNFTIDEAIAHWTTANNKDALARIAILQAHPIENASRRKVA